MKTKKLNRILKLIEELNETERNELLLQVPKQLATENTFIKKNINHCLLCGSEKIRLFGFYRGHQKYKCRRCNKTFTAYRHEASYGTHYPEKWTTFTDCMVDGWSIAKIAGKLDISIPTAFLWRHKLLRNYEKLANESLLGIVEADETFFLFSEKGNQSIKGRKSRKRGGTASKRGISDEQIPVIAGCDRDGHVILGVAKGGRISVEDIENVLNVYIGEDVVLCSDAHNSFQAYAKAYDFKYVGLNISQGQRVYRKKYHIQNVNSFHSRLKQWMKRFNGVSTKYLQNYMNWFSLLEETKKDANLQKNCFCRRLLPIN